ncbi:hypothetical protein [Mesobacterium pallidum]|uniref:hypothetical protein n=1 Tax=Mesobacterium pallidum TaxID=2872037 RepID=UPI001EE2937A|nr:hypothetical protein [Mesobacterium pallidum]
MLDTARKLARRHPVLLTAFALALVATVFFSARMAYFAAHWKDPEFHMQEPATWMTPRYISHAWHIPPEVVKPALQVPDDLAGRPTLEAIARARGVPVAVVMAELEALIASQGAAE